MSTHPTSEPILTYEAEFPADSLQVRAVIIETRDQLSGTVPASLLDRAEIALAEVLNNIAEHAFADAPSGTGQIDLTVSVWPTELLVEVADDGVPMPGEAPPEGKAPMVEGVMLQDLPEGGFGWSMIHQLVSSLSYRRVDDYNLVSFRVID